MNRRLPFALVLFALGCSESVPDFGPGPFRGALLDPEPLAIVSPKQTPTPTEAEARPIAEATTPPLAVQEVLPTTEIAAAPSELEPVVVPTPSTVKHGNLHTKELLTGVSPSAPASQPKTEPTTEVAIAKNSPGVEPADGAVVDNNEAALEDEELQLLNFDDLADFEYTAPTLDEIENGTPRPEQVPANVLAFDKKLVEIEGYMIPIEVEKGKVKSFILSRTLSGCCFGDMPNIQEWVDVRMQDDKDADYVPYAPVLVIGRISVGELVDEYGITSLYRMTAESVEDPW